MPSALMSSSVQVHGSNSHRAGSRAGLMLGRVSSTKALQSTFARKRVHQQSGRLYINTATKCVVGGTHSKSHAAGVRLIGCGSAAPEFVMTNADLEEFVETNDEWISSRTGIKQRHLVKKGETLAGLAIESCKQALEMGGVDAADVDLILMCTSTPDDIFGSACKVQAGIGAVNACAFDLTAACSGFVVGLVNATHMVRGGAFKNVLVVGGDTLSRFVDWRDRNTCVLFGDGCGAMLLQATEEDCNVLGFDLRSNGGMNGSLVAGLEDSAEAEDSQGTPKVLAGACATGQGSYENITMSGSDIFRFAVKAVPQVVSSALQAADMEASQIDHLVMHQANQRIMDSAADRLGIPHENVVSNIAHYGNTSAGSIPLAFDEAVRADRIKDGDVVALCGFGAGLTWGSALIRWGR